MSVYTDARSRPGAKLNTGTDDRELYMVKFGQMVLEAYAETNQYGDLTYKKSISAGKADTFPIIGRKRDAAEHAPGEMILGGTIEHNEVQIALDAMMVDSVFVAEVDELMADYALTGAYSRQLAESLSTLYDKRVATLHILASRVTTAPYTGGPVPSYAFHASMKTDASKLEDAAFQAVAYMRERDISGAPFSYRLPHQQHLLLARYAGIEGGPVSTGSGNRAQGTVGNIAGIPVKGVNHIPNTNVTTGNTKFRGNFTTTVGHISNEMAVGTLTRRGLKVVLKQQDERLGTLLIASQFCGHGILRPECSFEVATATR
ncbi:MAG: hypothetical protein AB1698_01670 [Pseudomonadota bacterium]